MILLKNRSPRARKSGQAYGWRAYWENFNIFFGDPGRFGKMAYAHSELALWIKILSRPKINPFPQWAAYNQLSLSAMGKSL